MAIESNSEFWDKYGGREDFNEASRVNAGKVPELDRGSEMPKGVEGVARLAEVKFGEYAKGEGLIGKPYVMFMAACVETTKGPNCNGMFTRIGPFPLAETPKGSLADNFRDVQMAVKKLLGPDPTQYDDAVLWENMQGTLAALVDGESKPHFRFRTWAMKKEVARQLPSGKWAVHVENDDGTVELATRENRKGEFISEAKLREAYKYLNKEPMVNHSWGSWISYEGKAKNPDVLAGATDRTVTREATSPPPPPPPPTAPAKPKHTPPAAKAKPASPPPPPVLALDVDEQDVESLGRISDDAKNPKRGLAEARLIELAKGAGIQQDAGGNFPGDTWADLAAMVAASGGTTEDVGAGLTYEVGNTFKLMLPADPKKPSVLKATSVEVEAIVEGGYTVKNLINNKTVMDPRTKLARVVGHSELEPDSDAA